MKLVTRPPRLKLKRSSDEEEKKDPLAVVAGSARSSGKQRSAEVPHPRIMHQRQLSEKVLSFEPHQPPSFKLFRPAKDSFFGSASQSKSNSKSRAESQLFGSVEL